MKDDVLKALERVIEHAKAHAGSFCTMEEYKQNEADCLLLRHSYINQPADEDRQALIDNYNHVWKWVERAIWCEKLKESALNCLKHSPYAPWNDPAVDWDTSHKEYHAEIEALQQPDKPFDACRKAEKGAERDRQRTEGS